MSSSPLGQPNSSNLTVCCYLPTLGASLVKDHSVQVAQAVDILKKDIGNVAQARRKILIVSSARDMTVKITKFMTALSKVFKMVD